jgi:aldose 1-epimerase
MNDSLQRQPFGRLPSGAGVEAIRLRNRRGLAARILTYGGVVAGLDVPDRNGRSDNIVLGFETLDACCNSPHYIGPLIGRYANRIARGRFLLDGVEYQIPVNLPPNALHGGPRGFSCAVWSIEREDAGELPAVTLSHVSPDGDQGFPGQLSVQARFLLLGDALQLEFTATTDRPTVINLTSHWYFNLAGAGRGDILGHELLIPAESFLPADATLIPTGEVRPVAGTPFDFRQPMPIGARIDRAEQQIACASGYDHSFVLPTSADGTPVLAARVREPNSGRVMEMWTTEPSVHFYSGNSLGTSDVGLGGRAYRPRDGFCLETQHYPDAPNRPHFPSTVLRPGETFRSVTAFRFSIDTAEPR